MRSVHSFYSTAIEKVELDNKLYVDRNGEFGAACGGCELCAGRAVQTEGSVTVSPGLTETATTVPGIGDRRMLLVSSATFSGMKEFSCAANLDRMRTWNCLFQKEVNCLHVLYIR